MSLQYKVEVYLRKAIRRADFVQSDSGRWYATLAELRLVADESSRDEAERSLLVALAAQVALAFRTGARLPVIDDVDLSEDVDPGPQPEDREGSMTLTAQESRTVAEAIANPRAPNAYLREAARAYQEFVNR